MPTVFVLLYENWNWELCNAASKKNMKIMVEFFQIEHENQDLWEYFLGQISLKHYFSQKNKNKKHVWYKESIPRKIAHTDFEVWR